MMYCQFPNSDCRFDAVASSETNGHSSTRQSVNSSTRIDGSTNRRIDGFTLTELMVAVAITAILILAINQVFTTVSDAVGRGAALSEVMAAHRLISDQLRRDFDRMVGPTLGDQPGGVLVIVNRFVRGVDNNGDGMFNALDGGVGLPNHFLDGGDPHGILVLRSDDYNNDGQLDGNEPRRPVRDDQFMFIRERGNLQPLCPGSNSSYAPDPDAADGTQFVKVWYGHALRVDPRGSTHIDDPTRYRVRELGQPDLDGSPPPTIVQGLNQFASEWILGRQALFLRTTVPNPAGNFVQINVDTGGDFSARLWETTTPHPDNTIEHTAPDGGVVLERPVNGNPVIIVPPSLYAGLADVAKYGLNAPDHDDPTGTIPTFGCMVGNNEDTGVVNANLRIWKDIPADFTYPGGGYADRAYRYMYIPAPLSNPAGLDFHARLGRLWVNPAPNPDLDADLLITLSGSASHPDENYFTPWQIAQMHPYLAGRISDFSVEFAGDYFNDASAQTVAIATAQIDLAAIPQPDMGPDGTIDHYDDLTTVPPGDAGIIWYGIDVHPPVDTTAAPPQGAFTDVGQTSDVQNPIFDDRDPPDHAGTIYPQVFNIGTTVLPGLVQHYTDIRYVFRHGSGNTNWPHLIRIRYRIHDPQNKIVDPDGEPGRWFEVILKVKRE